MGNDIFDAIAGAPGTYLSIGMNGELNWGFSLNLYTSVASIGSTGALPLNLTGYTYLIQNLGAYSVASGFLADYLSAEQENAQLTAQLPAGASNDIYTIVATLAATDRNLGQEPQPQQNYFWDAVGN
jgi:hypothetical protein